MDALAARDGTIEVPGRQEQESAGFEQPRNQGYGGGRIRKVFDDFDHADHIVTPRRLAREFVEVEDAKTIGAFQQLRI
jgi:hypothetical protein